MENLPERLYAGLTDPDATLDTHDIEEALAEYPFFTLPAVKALRGAAPSISPELRRRLMENVALNTPDPASLLLLEPDQAALLRDFYPEEPGVVTTDDAITKFLDTYGHSDPAQDALLERLIFNPVPPDYTSLLEQEGTELPEPEAPVSDQDAVIEAFLGGTPAPAETPAPLHEPEPIHREPRHTPPAPDHSLSESLAKIYIRQKRYDKAFEIIHTLSLNNPKKSAYFADQLRFLAKLMLVKKQQTR